MDFALSAFTGSVMPHPDDFCSVVERTQHCIRDPVGEGGALPLPFRHCLEKAKISFRFGRFCMNSRMSKTLPGVSRRSG